MVGTPPRPPFISLKDRELARAAAKAQLLQVRTAYMPALALLVSCLSVLVAVTAATTANVTQRAELVRLLESEIREAVPAAQQASMAHPNSRGGNSLIEPFHDIEEKLNEPFAGFRISQVDIEQMRIDVAWRHAIDESMLAADRAEAQLRKDIEAAKASEESRAKAQQPAPQKRSRIQGPSGSASGADSHNAH